jgi:hypothetical protein
VGCLLNYWQTTCSIPNVLLGKEQEFEMSGSKVDATELTRHQDKKKKV